MMRIGARFGIGSLLNGRVATAALFLVLISTENVFANDSLWIERSDSDPVADIKLPSFAPVIEKLGAAVVNISIEGKEQSALQLRQKPQFSIPQDEEQAPQNPWEYFGPEPEGPRSFRSLGSGFVIHPDGFIVTNNHVVENAEKITVKFRDDRKSYEAKLVGRDKKTDIALLKVVDSPGKLSSVVVGNSDGLRPGDWVIAIGNPFYLGHTATVGIVSAKSRKVGAGPYEDFIQTDASINPGNSGGPLFNALGEVVGVNTAIFSPGRMGATGFNIGIGFAIPINAVKDVVTQLHDKGKVVRGWLGVYIQAVTPDVADAMGLKQAKGALVADVSQDSPAEAAGFQRGDVILSFDGKPITEESELPLLVAKTEIGKTVGVEILRKGEAKSLKANIKELKDEDDSAPDSGEQTKLGLAIQEITPDIAMSLGVNEGEGLVVTNVEAGSPAEEAGLRRGDVILEADSKAVKSRRQFLDMVGNLKKAKPLLLLVRRQGNTLFLTLKVK